MDKLAEINHGAKVVLGASILFLIISFFNWQEVDLGAFGEAGVSMWHGVGWIAGLLADRNHRLASDQAREPQPRDRRRAGHGHRVPRHCSSCLFTVIKFFADSEFRTLGRMGRAHPRDRAVAGGAWVNMKLTGESIADLQKLGGPVEPEAELLVEAVEHTALDAHRHDAATAAPAVRRRHPGLLAPFAAGPLPPEEGPAAAV